MGENKLARRFEKGIQGIEKNIKQRMSWEMHLREQVLCFPPETGRWWWS